MQDRCLDVQALIRGGAGESCLVGVLGIDVGHVVPTLPVATVAAAQVAAVCDVVVVVAAAAVAVHLAVARNVVAIAA
eukprot:1178724-Prorocentrum_lima.AAC.1